MMEFNTLLQIRRLEHRCLDLGFKFSAPRHGMRNHDVIALVPAGDQLPIYSRDAELFVGTFEELEIWLRGVEWARQYDQLLKVSDQKRREQREQRYREQRLVEILSSTKQVKQEEK